MRFVKRIHEKCYNGRVLCLNWRLKESHSRKLDFEIFEFFISKRDRRVIVTATRSRLVLVRVRDSRVCNPETVSYSCLSKSRTSFSSSVAWGHCKCRVNMHSLRTHPMDSFWFPSCASTVFWTFLYQIRPPPKNELKNSRTDFGRRPMATTLWYCSLLSEVRVGHVFLVKARTGSCRTRTMFCLNCESTLSAKG